MLEGVLHTEKKTAILALLFHVKHFCKRNYFFLAKLQILY